MTQQAPPLTRVAAAIRGRLGQHPDRAALLLLLAVALTLRLAFTFRAPTFVVHDSVTYFASGYDFARGGGFGLAFKRTPLYPLFISAVVALVSEDLQALAFVQHLLGLTTVVLTYFLGRALFGRLAGILAGLLVALSGPLIIYEHYILAEPLFIPLLLAFALSFVRAVKVGGWRSFLMAGVLLGLVGLTRPVGQAVLLALPVPLWLALRPGRRAALRFGLAAAGFAAVTLPWMLRNYVQNGSLESAGATGQTLVGRITRHDEGFVIPSPDSPSPLADPVRTEARSLILRQMAREARPSAINHRLRETYGWNEAEANRAMRDACLEILSAQKERYLYGSLVKLRRLMWGDPEDFLGYHWAGRKSNEMRDDWTAEGSIAALLPPPTPIQEAEKANAAMIVGLFSPANPPLRWVLFVLLLVGLGTGFNSSRWSVAFFVLLTLALTVPAALLVGYVPRYRYPADPFMAVVIGAGLTWLAGQLVRLCRPTGRSALTPALSQGERGTELVL